MSKIKWISDPAHSEILFKVRHLMITTVTGHFKKFQIEAFTETDDFNTTSSIEFTALVESIETNNEQRNNHLKSPDFFDAIEFPELKFTAATYEANNIEGTLNGFLTIRDIEKPLSVNVQFGGIVVDPYGQTKAGFTIETTISRKAFGLKYGALTEAGGVVVGDEVKIHGEIQFIKQV